MLPRGLYEILHGVITKTSALPVSEAQRLQTFANQTNVQIQAVTVAVGHSLYADTTHQGVGNSCC